MVVGSLLSLWIGMPSSTARAQQPALAGKALVFDEVTVVDVERGQLLPAQRVTIQGNHIQAVGSSGTVRVPHGAQVVDARGKYLIPGFWDMHAHADGSAGVPEAYSIALRGYQLDLAFGITGVRDPASIIPLDTLIRWRREILAGTRVGPPRQILSVIAFNTCWAQNPVGPGRCLSDSAHARQDANRLIDSLKTAGLDMLKMYNLAPTDYFALAAAARRAGLRFGGHIFWTRASPITVSDSGASIIDHITWFNVGEFYWQCFGLDTVGPQASTAEHPPGAGQVSADRCRPVAEAFRRNNTWAQLGPISQFSRRLMLQRDKVVAQFWAGALPTGNWLGHVPPAPLPLEPWERDPDVTFRIASQVGLPVLAGSDAGGIKGFPLHTELATMVELGLTPLEALRAATLNPAKMLDGTDSLGTVAAGKLADLVLLDANPLEDITNTTTIRAMVANGRYFDRAALDRLLAEVQRGPKMFMTR